MSAVHSLHLLPWAIGLSQGSSSSSSSSCILS
jgi:hypothetical protein